MKLKANDVGALAYLGVVAILVGGGCLWMDH